MTVLLASEPLVELLASPRIIDARYGVFFRLHPASIPSMLTGVKGIAIWAQIDQAFSDPVTVSDDSAKMAMPFTPVDWCGCSTTAELATRLLYGAGLVATACCARRWNSSPRAPDLRRLNRNVNSPEVVVEVGVLNASAVGADEPSFEECRHAVHTGQELVGEFHQTD